MTINNVVRSIIIILVFFCACKSSHVPVTPPPPIDKDWTLNSDPNALDIVGAVFAVDKNGNRKYIPGSTLQLKTQSSPVAVTSSSKTKNVAFGSVINLLSIKNIDSLANVHFYDTVNVITSFKLTNATLTRIDDDIQSAFGQKKRVIESNIKTLGLQESSLYIILETIQSSNLAIVFDRTTNWGAGLDAKFKEIVKANPNLSSSAGNKADLTYSNTTPATIFYKLNALTVTPDKDRGNAGGVKYIVALGAPVDSSALNIRH